MDTYNYHSPIMHLCHVLILIIYLQMYLHLVEDECLVLQPGDRVGVCLAESGGPIGYKFNPAAGTSYQYTGRTTVGQETIFNTLTYPYQFSAAAFITTGEYLLVLIYKPAISARLIGLLSIMHFKKYNWWEILVLHAQQYVCMPFCNALAFIILKNVFFLHCTQCLPI